jgi:hypothetical protein
MEGVQNRGIALSIVALFYCHQNLILNGEHKKFYLSLRYKKFGEKKSKSQKIC